MNTIKVTVNYETPNTTKFDALVEQYKIAQTLAKETVSYYQPLAETAEEKMFEAIQTQLETIYGYVKKMYEILASQPYYTGFSLSIVGDPELENPEYRTAINQDLFKIHVDYKGCVETEWKTTPFTKEEFLRNRERFTEGSYNILGKWNEWKIYERLESRACRCVQSYIDNENGKAQQIIDRFNNISRT